MKLKHWIKEYRHARSQHVSNVLFGQLEWKHYKNKDSERECARMFL